MRANYQLDFSNVPKTEEQLVCLICGLYRPKSQIPRGCSLRKKEAKISIHSYFLEAKVPGDGTAHISVNKASPSNSFHILPSCQASPILKRCKISVISDSRSYLFQAIGLPNINGGFTDSLKVLSAQLTFTALWYINSAHRLKNRQGAFKLCTNCHFPLPP